MHSSLSLTSFAATSTCLRYRLHSLSILLVMVLLLSGCFKSTKTVVEKVETKQNGMKMEGVFYALPRTLVKVKIPVEREDQIPGEYPQFARCFLPEQADDAILNRTTSFSLGTPEFEEKGVPDLTQVYMIHVKGGYFEDKSLTLALTEAGVFTSVDSSSEDESVDIALSVLDTAVSVGTELAGIRSAERIARLRRDALFNVDSLSPSDAMASALFNSRNVSAMIQKATPADSSELAKMPADNEHRLTKEENDCYKKFEASYVLQKLAKAKYKKEVEDTLNTPIVQKRLEFRVKQRLDEELDKSSSEAEKTRTELLIRTEEIAKIKDEIREDIKSRWLGASIGQLDQSGFMEVAGVASDLNLLKLEVKEFYSEAKEKFKEIQAKQQKAALLIEGANLPNTHSESLKMTVERLSLEITALQKRYFLGFKRTENWTGTFTYDPPDVDSKSADRTAEPKRLFVFSNKGGICALLDEQGNKVKPSFKIADKCTDTFKSEKKEVALQLTRNAQQLAAAISSNVSARDNQKERGFYYRVPGVAMVSLVLIDASNQVSEKARKTDVQIAQYGTTASLPAGTGGRKTKYVLSLFESSGALKNFAMGSDALITKSQIEGLNSTVTESLEAKAKRKQAELDAELESKDELKRLKREREILEERNKIEAERKKLQGTSP